MRRRDFITLLGGAATWPFAARAQQPTLVARIGYVSGTGSAADPGPWRSIAPAGTEAGRLKKAPARR
jgi:hypothetical protein